MFWEIVCIDTSVSRKLDSVSSGQDIEGYQPVWFEKRTDDTTGESTYVYKGGYWEAKERQDWSQCSSIFQDDIST